MIDRRSFCESVYAAKAYREIRDAHDPQVFMEISQLELRGAAISECAPMPKHRYVNGVTYVFPWSELLPAGVRPLYWAPNVYIRFWYDPKSGEMRICYLKPHQVLPSKTFYDYDAPEPPEWMKGAH